VIARTCDTVAAPAPSRPKGSDEPAPAFRPPMAGWPPRTAGGHGWQRRSRQSSPGVPARCSRWPAGVFAGRRLCPVVRATWHIFCTFSAGAFCSAAPECCSGRLPQSPSHGHDPSADTSSAEPAPRCNPGEPRPGWQAPAGRTSPAGPARFGQDPHTVHRCTARPAAEPAIRPGCGQDPPPAPCHHDAPLPSGWPARPWTNLRVRRGAACATLGEPSGSLPRHPAVEGEPAQPVAASRSLRLRRPTRAAGRPCHSRRAAPRRRWASLAPPGIPWAAPRLARAARARRIRLQPAACLRCAGSRAASPHPRLRWGGRPQSAPGPTLRAACASA